MLGFSLPAGCASASETASADLSFETLIEELRELRQSIDSLRKSI
jgi:hypothetical protein